jgi:tagatose 1,6-diphosphate aldolase GatY/KbaY
VFIPLKFMLEHAKKNRYAINRFTVFNLEGIEALIQAAEKTDSPIVYCLYEFELKNICLSCLESLIKKLGDEAKVPVAIFSDHVMDLDTCIKIFDRGYGGLMIDASRLPHEENIMVTSEVVKYANKHGAFVEGEVGVIQSGRRDDIKENVQTELTNPALASDFVTKTSLDCLAVSIGVKSGFYDTYPGIDYDLLKEIRNNVNVILCLHGASGLLERDVKKCIENGISFMAWSTDIRYAFYKKIDEIREQKGEKCILPDDIMIPARDEMRDEIIRKIIQTGSNNRGSELIRLYNEQKCKERNSEDLTGYYSGKDMDINKMDINKIIKVISDVVTEKIKEQTKD